ncbi:MAG: hypothetical protein IJ711_06025 [Lachnospiraceae bacterium]|nr:hypothetical protein [Lachnospiraceae bacterium]
MRNLMKKALLTALIAGFMLFLLLHSAQAKEFAYLGLHTWFHQLIPSLLPFMILSGLLIRLNLISLFCKPFHLILRPLFRMSDACIYVLVTGFLCGFPMGAKNIADLYRQNRLTRDEAEFLLAFTNNIGPVYFLSFVLGNVYQTSEPLYGCLCQFLLPLGYGLFLRYSLYRTKIALPADAPKRPSRRSAESRPLVSFFDALDESITGALVQIAILGGYMIVFNLLALLASVFFRGNPYQCFAHSLLELSGGLEVLRQSDFPEESKLLLAHLALSFNGLCCLFQTLHLIRDTDLSGQKYMLHKIILCSITLFVLVIGYK